MDRGVEIGLFAAALGVPLVLLFALLGSMQAAAVTLVLVATLSVSLVIATRIADGRSKSESAGSDTATERDTTDPLESLQNRYARGEITETEFERQLETVLETGPSRSGDETAMRSDEGSSREHDLERS